MKSFTRQIFNIFAFIFVFFLITYIDFDYRPSQVINIYTTNYPLKYMVETLGGDSVSVKSLYEHFEPKNETIVDESTAEESNDSTEDSGLETVVTKYTYIPTKAVNFVLDGATADLIAQSDLYLYSGYSLEKKHIATLLAADGVDYLDIRDATHSLQKIDYNKTEPIEIQSTSYEGEVPISYTINVNDYLYKDMLTNPNVWADPINMLQMAATTKDILKSKLPTKTEIINENFDKFKGNILRYDSKLQQTIDNGRNNIVIVDRPFLAHLQRYGLEQINFANMFSYNIIDESDFEDIYNIMQHYEITKVLTDDPEDMTTMFKLFIEKYDLELVSIHALDILPVDDYENGEDFFTIVNTEVSKLEELLR